jgi:hypothetical protein
MNMVDASTEALLSFDDPVAVLNALLHDIRDATPAKPSNATIEAALQLCTELTAHLHSLRGCEAAPNTDSSARSPLTITMPVACESQCTSQCTTSESDSESHARSKNRPNSRARARARRAQLSQEQQQEEEEEVVVGYTEARQQRRVAMQPELQPELHPSDTSVPWMWHAPNQQLPGLMEQQEQHFRESLWGGGWLMVPVPPQQPVPNGGFQTPPFQEQHAAICDSGTQASAYPASSHDAGHFCQTMWNGAWHMMPLGCASSGQAECAGESLVAGTSEEGATGPVSYEHPCGTFLEMPQSTPPCAPLDAARDAPPTFKKRVARCMKAHRWFRMQRVWTEWMRDDAALNEAPQLPQHDVASSIC